MHSHNGTNTHTHTFVCGESGESDARNANLNFRAFRSLAVVALA